MLRQIVFIIDGEILYQYNFARAYNSEDLKTVLGRIREYFERSTPGKFFHRPMLDFQIVFGFEKNIFYLFVCDLADRYNYVEEEIRKLSKNIEKLGGSDNINLIIEAKNQELTDFFQEIHYNLHPKISVVGPIGVGKSSLINLLKLKEVQPRNIMSFAQISQIKISGILFDVWDFVEFDDYSPLWGNFIRGSDLIILIFNSTQIVNNANKIIHFINLCKKEGKVSKIFTVLSHYNQENAVKLEKYTEEFGDLINSEVFSYDLENSDALDIIKDYVSDSLLLKKSLPDNFRQLVVESNEAITEKKYLKAIQKLKLLLNISDNYQETTYFEIFTKKIKELEQKVEEQKSIMKLEKLKIKAPEKIEFGTKVKVKELKSLSAKEPIKFLKKPELGFGLKMEDSSYQKNQTNGDVKKISEKKELIFPRGKKGIKNNLLTFERSPLIKNKIIEPHVSKKVGNSVKIDNKTKHRINEEKFKKIESEEILEKKLTLHSIFTKKYQIEKPVKIQGQPKFKKESDEEKRLMYEQDLLYDTIKKLGYSLRKDLCLTFILQIRTKLKKAYLEDDYIINAANLYIKRV
jgi:GTPase SAR1 family protein